MANTSSPPLAGSSFFEKLPAELIENILIRVVGDV
jgi:hypothetical protein